jgi:hypothetical protein
VNFFTEVWSCTLVEAGEVYIRPVILCLTVELKVNVKMDRNKDRKSRLESSAWGVTTQSLTETSVLVASGIGALGILKKLGLSALRGGRKKENVREWKILKQTIYAWI